MRPSPATSACPAPELVVTTVLARRPGDRCMCGESHRSGWVARKRLVALVQEPVEAELLVWEPRLGPASAASIVQEPVEPTFLLREGRF